MASESSTSYPTLSGPTVRRTQHKGKRQSQSHTAVGKFSQTYSSATEDYYTPHVSQMEPSYRMGPADGERFNVSTAQKFMYEMLQHYLENQKYEPKACASLSKVIGERIRNKGKESNFSPRYRFISQVSIAQNKGQGLHSVSRSCWNSDTDNFATVSYMNGSLVAIAILFATYYD